MLRKYFKINDDEPVLLRFRHVGSYDRYVLQWRIGKWWSRWKSLREIDPKTQIPHVLINTYNSTEAEIEKYIKPLSVLVDHFSYKNELKFFRNKYDTYKSIKEHIIKFEAEMVGIKKQIEEVKIRYSRKKILE